jgi:Flp pilus assembly protein TadG
MRSNNHDLKSTTYPSSQAANRRGTTAVEMAIVAPLVFLLIFSSFEFARMLMASHGLEEAAREGCRQAILADATLKQVQDTVQNRLTTFGLKGYTLTVDPAQPSLACQYDPVSVNITVPYTSVSLLPTPRFLGAITLRASCTLPRESDECTN